MACHGLPLVFGVAQKVKGDDGEVGIGEVDWARLDEAPHSAGKVKARILSAEKHVKAGKIPGCDLGTFGCPYFSQPYHHSKETPLERVDDSELAQWVRSYYTARVDEKYAAEQKAEAAANIRALLEEREDELGVTRYEVEDEAHNKFRVRWMTREMPERTMKASTQSYPDVKLVEDK
jgi:hypothetical protein